MVPLSTILLIIWVSGTSLAIVPVAAGLMRMRRLRQHCRGWRAGERFVASVAAELGVGRRIQVLLDDDVDSPLMSGVLRPAIIFPADVGRWPMEAVQRAILHEVEHVRRADWLTLCSARSVCAVYWFHPLVWTLWRQLRLQAERACDDAVLRSEDAEAYADQLVTLAERLASNRMPGALPMVHRNDLSARVAAVLDRRQQRGRAGAVCTTSAAVVAVLAIMTVAPLRAIPETRLVRAQTPPVTFDVASIRPTPPDPPVTTIGNPLPGGRWSPRNVTIRAMLSRAFPEYAHPGMIVGGPEWIDERRFDIDAKTDKIVTPAQYPEMIRQLLAERFKLRTHIEARPVDVYALVVARGDGRLGPRMRPASSACTKELEAARELERAWRAGSVQLPGPEPKPCNVQVSMDKGMMRISGGRSMNELATALQSWTDLKIVERTNLRGDYETELQFDFRGTLSAANADPDKPSVFTALQEQLGLRLQRNRESVDVLVVDSIDMPSEN
jgi:uncharacterized protein (TIGR03435 family)